MLGLIFSSGCAQLEVRESDTDGFYLKINTFMKDYDLDELTSKSNKIGLSFPPYTAETK
jgi:hypothetical protein